MSTPHHNNPLFPEAVQLFNKLDEILPELRHARKDIKTIMSQQDKLQAVLDQINTATTAQGVVLSTEAASLQKVSDNLDALLAKLATGEALTDEEIASAQAAADHVSAISTSMQAQADFATALASKGEVTPVPMPVPPVTPVPTPAS